MNLNYNVNILMIMGFVHIYTGNGRGKTTAAIGLAIRAAGAGFKVAIVQFLKGMEYSEIKALKSFSLIEVYQYGRKCFIKSLPEDEDIKIAREGISFAEKLIKSGKYRLVVLDEVNVAIHFGLISTEQVLEVIKNSPENVDILLTGRYATQKLIDSADLVTEMVEIKHYYNKGIKARRGFEF